MRIIATNTDTRNASFFDQKGRRRTILDPGAAVTLDLQVPLLECRWPRAVLVDEAPPSDDDVFAALADDAPESESFAMEMQRVIGRDVFGIDYSK